MPALQFQTPFDAFFASCRFSERVSDNQIADMIRDLRDGVDDATGNGKFRFDLDISQELLYNPRLTRAIQMIEKHLGYEVKFNSVAVDESGNTPYSMSYKHTLWICWE